MTDKYDRIDSNIKLLHDRFISFRSVHVGENLSMFDRLPLPTSKDYSVALLNIQYGQHIKSGLIPFILPKEDTVCLLPAEPSRIDVLQYYLDGVAALIVAKSLHPDQERFSKVINTYLAVGSFMVEKLSSLYRTSQAQNNFPTSSSLTTTASINPLITHFKKEVENIKQLRDLCIISNNNNNNNNNQNSKTTPISLHNYSNQLFALLHGASYWKLQGISDMEKLEFSNSIYTNLRHIVQDDPSAPLFRYSLGSFCYSYFKLHQMVHRIGSLQFFNFHKEHSFDRQLHSKMYSYLKESNQSYLIEFEKEPVHHPEFWFIYAKTCCLLDIEEKAQSWIQLFINDAFDRIKVASIVRNDQDISPYFSKEWYIEIMTSIDAEESRLIAQQIKIEQNRLDQLKLQQQQVLIQQQQQQLHQLPPPVQQQQQEFIKPNNNNHDNQSLYHEFKQNLIIDGFAPKYMNNDSLLISSIILLSMSQPTESKEAEIAKKRLSERLDLYMLQNSKEIPGDGNCQMHALSDQLYGDLNHSLQIRKTIVDWLRKNKDFAFPNGATLCQFVNGSWEDYCNEMSKNGIWGDHLTLLAAAEIYKAKISIISSVESTSHFFIEIIPTKIESTKVLLLSHYSEFHYGSLCFKA